MAKPHFVCTKCGTKDDVEFFPVGLIYVEAGIDKNGQIVITTKDNGVNATADIPRTLQENNPERVRCYQCGSPVKKITDAEDNIGRKQKGESLIRSALDFLEGGGG